MSILVVLLGLVIVQGSNGLRLRRQIAGADVSTRDTVICIVNCMDKYERSGVDGPVETPSPLENGCSSLDFRELVGMCKGYRKADECLKLCPNDETKKIMLAGLDYICKDHYEDFQNYTPCFNKQCPMIELECGPHCGTLEEAQESYFKELENSNETEVELERRRRKRQSALYQTTTPSSSEEETESVGPELVKLGFADTCKYINCYINCSRTRMIATCGQEAQEMLSYIAHMLFSFLVAPYQQMLGNANTTEMVQYGCDMKALALPLKHNTASSAILSINWMTLLASSIVLAIISKMRN